MQRFVGALIILTGLITIISDRAEFLIIPGIVHGLQATIVGCLIMIFGFLFFFSKDEDNDKGGQ